MTATIEQAEEALRRALGEITREVRATPDAWDEIERRAGAPVEPVALETRRGRRKRLVALGAAVAAALLVVAAVVVIRGVGGGPDRGPRVTPPTRIELRAPVAVAGVLPPGYAPMVINGVEDTSVDEVACTSTRIVDDVVTCNGFAGSPELTYSPGGAVNGVDSITVLTEYATEYPFEFLLSGTVTDTEVRGHDAEQSTESGGHAFLTWEERRGMWVGVSWAAATTPDPEQLRSIAEGVRIEESGPLHLEVAHGDIAGYEEGWGASDLDAQWYLMYRSRDPACVELYVMDVAFAARPCAGDLVGTDPPIALDVGVRSAAGSGGDSEAGFAFGSLDPRAAAVRVEFEGGDAVEAQVYPAVFAGGRRFFVAQLPVQKAPAPGEPGRLLDRARFPVRAVALDGAGRELGTASQAEQPPVFAGYTGPRETLAEGEGWEVTVRPTTSSVCWAIALPGADPDECSRTIGGEEPPVFAVFALEPAVVAAFGPEGATVMRVRLTSGATVELETRARPEWPGPATYAAGTYPAGDSPVAVEALDASGATLATGPIEEYGPTGRVSAYEPTSPP